MHHSSLVDILGLLFGAAILPPLTVPCLACRAACSSWPLSTSTAHPALTAQPGAV